MEEEEEEEEENKPESIGVVSLVTINQPTCKGPISPVLREPATSSATAKQDEIKPVRANHTTFAIQTVTPHGITIFLGRLPFPLQLFCTLINPRPPFGVKTEVKKSRKSS
ncbi:hypothetical protein ACFX2I_014413 [Malus domestica]